jgi:hypothetical protein
MKWSVHSLLSHFVHFKTHLLICLGLQSRNFLLPVHVIMCGMDLMARKSNAVPFVARIAELPKAVSQAHGFMHFEKHLNQTATTQPHETRITAAFEAGKRLVKRLMQRADWMWRLKCESPTYRDQPLHHNPMFIEMCCKVVALVPTIASSCLRFSVSFVRWCCWCIGPQVAARLDSIHCRNWGAFSAHLE